MKNSWNVALVLSIVIILLVVFGSDLGLQSVFLTQDSIYMDVYDRDYTEVMVTDELYPYTDLHLVINSIGGSGITERGVNPYNYFYVTDDGYRIGTGACSNVKDQVRFLTQCCQALGYTDFRSDSGWNVCYRTYTEYPNYIKIFVGGTEVYYWDYSPDGGFPTESDNFADIVNEECGLNEPILYCEDPKYAYSNEYSKCVYYQEKSVSSECIDSGAVNLGSYGEDYITCSLPVLEREYNDECTVRVSVDTGNGYGSLNMGLYVSSVRGSVGDITLVQPPILENSTPTDQAGNDVTNESASVEDFWSYIQQKLTFINMLIALLSILVIGGLLYVWKFKR